ncbi:MAG: sulfite exporter TauE/SafE family protein [Helicobacteraceae bacterium]|nr:sulfite exporter TauE/SafE family protein [Helicobacteraceae bacterium]
MDHNIGHFVIENANYISIFIIALSTSFSHCLGMCGGIVVAYSQISLKGMIFSKILGHFLYGFGRITTYVTIGIIFAYLGKSFAINNSTEGGIFIIVGLIMVLFALAFLFMPKMLQFLEPNIGNFRIFKSFFNFILRKKSLFSLYILGILNGAIPCGFVYFFAMNAAISGSILNGALSMLVFGVATLIPLILLGMFNTLLNLTKYRRIFTKISGIFIFLFGIYTIIRGFKILFI